MEKLNNPPIVSAIYGIWWHLFKEKEQKQSEHLQGDFFNVVRNEYKDRKLGSYIYKPPFPTPQQLTEFKKSEKDDLSIILGRDELELKSTNKEEYKWGFFKKEIDYGLEKLFKVLASLEIEPDHYHLYLKYSNFISFGDDNSELFEFINKSFSINISQNFDDTVKNYNEFEFYCNYSFKEDSSVSVNLKKKKKGILVNIEAISGKENPYLEHISKWNNDAHEKCEDIFLKLFKPIFNTFK